MRYYGGLFMRSRMNNPICPKESFNCRRLKFYLTLDKMPVEPEKFFCRPQVCAPITRISETQTRNNYRSGGIGSGTYKRLSETSDPSR